MGTSLFLGRWSVLFISLPHHPRMIKEKVFPGMFRGFKVTSDVVITVTVLRNVPAI